MARRWGVTPEGLRSKARIKTLTVPRQIAMFMGSNLGNMAEPEAVAFLKLVRGHLRQGDALMLGLDRVSAARFSFLLSIPIIILSGGYQGSKLLAEPTHYDVSAILLGTGLSFVSAFICIHLFLKVIERMGMLPFVIYRLILGIVLLAVLSSAT